MPVRLLVGGAAIALLVLAVLLGAGCGGEPGRAVEREAGAASTAAAAADGTLTARPRARVAVRGAVGALVLDGGARLSVPGMYRRTRPAPFALVLHGAGSGPAGLSERLLPGAAGAGMIRLAPKSRGSTWDAVRGEFGDDVAAIDRLLRRVFARYSIDPKRVYVVGFSDGASYALSLGLVNGGLFRRIVAFSPGYLEAYVVRGKPRIFVAHGKRDDVLPIDRTSRSIVSKLRSVRYAVTYREFAGPHTVPPPVARRAVAWLLGR